MNIKINVSLFLNNSIEFLLTIKFFESKYIFRFTVKYCDRILTCIFNYNIDNQNNNNFIYFIRLLVETLHATSLLS